MKTQIKSIRPFIGAKNYTISRQFYKDFGFEEIKTSEKMSYFKLGDFGFYLQDAHIKDWIDNTMVFLEIDNVEEHLSNLKKRNLEEKYNGVKISEINYNDWGKEYFVHDPSVILWHVGAFKKP
ncbi:glyoxalase [Hwangdonia lutea]|uniref:Glyoxalase n=1 Tax=Hwangdonia lutea TaxID=3075823 RepID=A0AA97ENB9_9FLAO|nr:glyoxalase [Hwangdonia sp. SCSIO 19198]WOD44517.1 glyoxalase [Hwangdonia sp. SCSIO 19198]